MLAILELLYSASSGSVGVNAVPSANICLMNITQKGFAGPYLIGDILYIFIFHLNLKKTDFEFWFFQGKIESGRKYIVSPIPLAASISKSSQNSLSSDVLYLLICTETNKSMIFFPQECWSILNIIIWSDVMVCQWHNID